MGRSYGFVLWVSTVLWIGLWVGTVSMYSRMGGILFVSLNMAFWINEQVFCCFDSDYQNFFPFFVSSFSLLYGGTNPLCSVQPWCTHTILFWISANLNFAEADKFREKQTAQSLQRSNISRVFMKSYYFRFEKSVKFSFFHNLLVTVFAQNSLELSDILQKLSYIAVQKNSFIKNIVCLSRFYSK